MKLALLALSFIASSSMAQSGLPCLLANAKFAEDSVRLTFLPKTDWMILQDGKGNSGLVGDGMVYRTIRDGNEIKGELEAEAAFLLGIGRTLVLSTHHQGCELTLEMREGVPVLRSEYGVSMPTGEAKLMKQWTPL